MLSFWYGDINSLPVCIPFQKKKSYPFVVLHVRHEKEERIGMILAEIQFCQKLYKIIVKGNVVNVVICLTTTRKYQNRSRFEERFHLGTSIHRCTLPSHNGICLAAQSVRE